METSRLHTRLPAPRFRSPGVLGAYLFASLALHGLVFGNQGTVGLGQSDAFTLDTMEPNPMVNIGLADSSGFELDTGGDDGSFRIGTDESSGFILNTLDSPSSIDLTRAGFSDSGGFRLDTEDSTLGFVGTMDTGFADSSIFSLDTSGGNAVAWDLNDTGYADSSGFQLDTRDDSLFGDSSFSDSAGFQLDTRETNEVVDRSYADSGSFQLDTGGHDGSLLFGFSDSGSFQLDTRNRDEVYNGDTNTSFADSSEFSLDTRDGDGGSNSTGGELVSVKGTIFYDGVVSGSAYVWAMEANGSKAAEDKISAGEGNYSILVEKGRAYDLKAFIDGNENGLISTGEPWGHYGEWNNTANRYNLLQVDGNLTHIHFSLEDRDTDSDGFLDWVEVEAGTDENNASSFPNTSPHFQSDGNLSVMENETFVHEFNASGPDVGTTLSYSILSGDDAGKFTLNTTTGGLSFTTAPDFESPDDNNSDNIYQLSIQVSDGEANATLNVSVSVQDKYEPSKENHTVDLNASVGLEMIWVEPGTFMKGSPTTEAGRNDAGRETQHEVTLTQGFYLGKYEVTQAQYEAVMTGNTDGLSATPSNWPNNPDRPVEKVSWDDIQKFLTRLNSQQASNIPEGWAYVLPTDAQWEYACRAGTTTAYSWGDSITTDNANYSDSGFSQTRDVGLYDSNPWGFFDMHGNVWEWTADWYVEYSSGAQSDPEGPATGSDRVNRGGSWNSPGTALRSALRRTNTPGYRHTVMGFRVGFREIPNSAPTELNATSSLAFNENLPVGSVITEFNATDPDGDSLAFSLVDGNGSTHNHLFSLETNGTLKTATSFDYETNASSYSIRVQAKDEHNASIEKQFTVTLLDVHENTAPHFQSDGNLSILENQAFIYDFEALDVDGDVVTYSLAGGDDASLFELIPSTGHLAFLSLPAFKSPMDKNGDNRYEVTLKVSDGQATASLDVVVQVIEKAEDTPNQAPQFQSDGNLSVEENQAFIYNFNALDADGDVVSYSLASGDDKEFFKLNEATGGLSFIAPRDFEKPEDANVDNVYELTIEAGDSFKNTALVLRVEVLDVSEDDKGDPTDSVGFAPTTIEGLGMFARDDGWAIYEETVTFDELGRFHAVITNGYDNPVAGGDYSYKKTGEDTAELSYSVDGGFPSFKYLLTFISDLSGTYTKESDYGDALSFTSGPFSFKATDNNPNTGGGGDGGVRAPESLAGMEVEIHFLELMPNGDYEDLGMEVVKFGEFDVSAFDADSQQIEYEPYIYKKTSETTALITLGTAGYEMEEISLTFLEAGFAEGTWLEIDAGEIFEGTLSFRIVGENKHTDGAGPGDDGEPPVTGSISFNTPSFVSVQEKDVFVTHINASGVGGADPTYSLLPGADSFFFELSPVTGKLSFRIPRDFHHPEDANLDNLYEVTIEASDGENSGFLDLVVGIFEIKEDPTDPGYPGGPGMGELVFITPDYFEVEENMNYIAQVQASGLGGYSISYSLNGGLDQKFFEIDPLTGDLRFFTTRDFDHPEDANQDNLYELSIKASDGESSAVLDLVVGILDMTDDPKEPGFPSDVLLPIVYTNLGEISESGEIHLSGRVLHDGGGKVEEVGFFLSPRLRIDPMGPETVRLPVHTEHDFSWLLDESPFPKRLYIQAYAINEAGMNRGAIKRIKIPEPPMFWWGDVKEREGGWSESSWFGIFKYYDHGWLFHSSLQWLFSSPVDGDGVWLWKDGMNWLWTGENIWPYMWSHDRGDWIYVTGGQSGDGFIFYDYSSSTYRDF